MKSIISLKWKLFSSISPKDIFLSATGIILLNVSFLATWVFCIRESIGKVLVSSKEKGQHIIENILKGN